jgi:hypothetical protein
VKGYNSLKIQKIRLAQRPGRTDGDGRGEQLRGDLVESERGHLTIERTRPHPQGTHVACHKLILDSLLVMGRAMAAGEWRWGLEGVLPRCRRKMPFKTPIRAPRLSHLWCRLTTLVECFKVYVSITLL